MEDLFEDWKKITTNTIAENGAFIHNKNNTIMNSIINYETEEIEGKENVKKIIYFLVPFLIILTAFQVWIGATKVTTINYIGYALMFVGLIFSYFNNRTDNFPDARVLPTTTYLQKVKENILARRKQHTINGITLFLFYIPGMFCSFYNYFIRGEYAPIANNFMTLLLVFLSIGMIVGSYYGLKQYDKRIAPLREDLENMMEEIK